MSRVDEALRRAAERAGHLTPATAEDLQFPQEGAVAMAGGVGVIDAPVAAELKLTNTAAVEEPVAAGEIPGPQLFERIDERLAQKVVVDQEMSPTSREQYRRLAATLHHAQEANGLKVILIASAVAGEGKTLTASNLALTLSESYQRSVLLIDADLRRPSLNTVFRIERRSGLSEGLSSFEERRMPVLQLSKNLSVLVAGKPSPDPMASLTSERMRRLIAEARESFDWVIIDTPPIGLLPDANLLGSMADGSVLVVKADSTPYPMVTRAIASLGPDRVLGVVLNRATVSPHASRYGYSYDYNYGYPRQTRAATE
jgi:receptor protein-tyrosine kinase